MECNYVIGRDKGLNLKRITANTTNQLGMRKFAFIGSLGIQGTLALKIGGLREERNYPGSGAPADATFPTASKHMPRSQKQLGKQVAV